MKPNVVESWPIEFLIRGKHVADKKMEFITQIYYSNLPLTELESPFLKHYSARCSAVEFFNYFKVANKMYKIPQPV